MQKISKETMIEQLVLFHTERLNRIGRPDMLQYYNYISYEKQSYKKIKKEYEEKFGHLIEEYARIATIHD